MMLIMACLWKAHTEQSDTTAARLQPLWHMNSRQGRGNQFRVTSGTSPFTHPASRVASLQGWTTGRISAILYHQINVVRLLMLFFSYSCVCPDCAIRACDCISTALGGQKSSK